MFYLIAERLGHSCSRELHAHFGDYEYEYKELAPDEVGDFMQGGDWEGLNVTIPYKTEVMKYLDEISPEAQAIGSVNTIVRRDGRKIGYNTDYYGFFAASNKAGILFGGRKVVILGTGGTSKTAQKVAADCGAAEIVVVSRTGENNYENISRHADADILVNTTPVGMYPKTNEKPISLSIFRNLTGVIDVIYNPLYTNLILEAQAAGIKNIGGLYMLTVQAAMASAFFTGVKPDRDAINGAYASLLRSRRNIVLVGMPGSGKSSIAAELGARLGRRVLDTDAVIVERAGMPIPEIFEKYNARNIISADLLLYIHFIHLHPKGQPYENCCCSLRGKILRIRSLPLLRVRRADQYQYRKIQHRQAGHHPGRSVLVLLRLQRKDRGRHVG